MSDRLEQLQKLYDAEPADPFLTYGIALEHAKAGQHDAALDWLEKTLALDSAYLYAWFQKAKILAESGKADEARTALDQGIDHARQANDAKALGELTELRDSLDSLD